MFGEEVRAHQCRTVYCYFQDKEQLSLDRTIPILLKLNKLGFIELHSHIKRTYFRVKAKEIKLICQKIDFPQHKEKNSDFLLNFFTTQKIFYCARKEK